MLISLSAVVVLTSSFKDKDPFPPLNKVLPLTTTEVFELKERIETTLQSTIDELLAIPPEEKTYANTIAPWDRMTHAFIADYGTLYFLSEANFPIKPDADLAMQELGKFLAISVFFNTDLQHSFMDYIQTALNNSPSPYECQVIHFFLNTYDSLQGILSDDEKQVLADLKQRQETELLTVDEEVLLAELTALDSLGRLSETDQATISQLKALLASQEAKPFIYKKGRASEKRSNDSGFTVLNLNVCFTPGNLVYFHAGVMPWEQRVVGLAYQIKQIGADVICLQEVHGEEAGYALYDKLKSDYAHFYFGIGPRPFGFSFDSCGLPSGLFVASKYPLANPQFTLFDQAGYSMNWGVFDFVVQNQNVPIAHVYTTHMQSLDFDPFPLVRAAQLEQLIVQMQADAALQGGIPYFLCGDLNIPQGSNEPAEELLSAYFHNAYNQTTTVVDADNRTCTYYFSNYFLSPSKTDIDPNFQILDYALLLKQSEGYRMQTSLMPMNDLDKPGWGLTDHHGLFTKISN